VLLRRAVIVLVAGALGVWVAIAAAQGGFGAGSSGTTCHPVGSTNACHTPRPGGAHGGGGGGGGHSHHHRHRHHHSREGERTHRGVEGGEGSSPVAPAAFAG
jgi:hypothetical protein